MSLPVQSLRILAALLLVVLVDLLLLTPAQHVLAQDRLRDELRVGLATGALPRGPFAEGSDPPTPVAVGDPVAQLTVPAIGVDEVVVEGTQSRQTAQGVGHRRDTVLPGQAGTSVLIGRAAAYGGPLARIGELAPGTRLGVLTGQGRFEYRVTGVRRAGDPMPPPLADGKGRLTLVTASGRAFAPSDVLRVDADLLSKAAAPLGAVRPGSAPADEAPMAGAAGSTMVPLVLLLQLLTAAVVGVAWAWRRWGRRQAWIVGLPVLLALGVLVADQVTYLLPNVM